MDDEQTRMSLQRTRTYLLGFIAFVLAGYVLVMAQSILLPTVLAIFLTILIKPALERLSRFMPEPLALVIVLLGAGCLVVGAAILVTSSLINVAAKMPAYIEQFRDEIDALFEMAQNYGVDVSFDSLGGENGVGYAVDFIGTGLGSAATLLSNVVIVLFITVFLVLEARQFGRKVDAAFQGTTIGAIRDSTESIIDQIQRYMLAKTAISLMTGVLTWLICLAVGVDFAFFWGLLTFLLNFIPNVGSIIAVIPPTIIAGLEFGDWFHPALVLGLLGTIQMLIGNLIEPRILGQQMSLSTLVVFLSMIAWGLIWGIMGVILAVPLTVALKIVFSHVEGLRPIAVFLGGEPLSRQELADRMGTSLELTNELLPDGVTVDDVLPGTPSSDEDDDDADSSDPDGTEDDLSSNDETSDLGSSADDETPVATDEPVGDETDEP